MDQVSGVLFAILAMLIIIGGKGCNSCVPSPPEPEKAELVDKCPKKFYPISKGETIVLDGTTNKLTDDVSHSGWECGDVRPHSAPDAMIGMKLPSDGVLTVDVAGKFSGFNPAIYLRQSCNLQLLCFDNRDDGLESLAENITEGDWIVVIDGTDSTMGDFTLSIHFDKPVCGDGVVSEGEDCDVGESRPLDGCGDPSSANECRFEDPSPSEDKCPGQPVLVQGGRTVLSRTQGHSTLGFSDDYSPSCSCSTGSPDRVYDLQPQKDGTLTVKAGFDTDASDGGVPSAFVYPSPFAWNVVLYARTTCEEAKTEVACADDEVRGPETISFPVTAFEHYYVFVDGYSSGDYPNAGPYNLEINLE